MARSTATPSASAVGWLATAPPLCRRVRAGTGPRAARERAAGHPSGGWTAQRGAPPVDPLPGPERARDVCAREHGRRHCARCRRLRRLRSEPDRAPQRPAGDDGGVATALRRADDVDGHATGEWWWRGSAATAALAGAGSGRGAYPGEQAQRRGVRRRRVRLGAAGSRAERHRLAAVGRRSVRESGVAVSGGLWHRRWSGWWRPACWQSACSSRSRRRSGASARPPARPRFCSGRTSWRCRSAAPSAARPALPQGWRAWSRNRSIRPVEQFRGGILEDRHGDHGRDQALRRVIPRRHSLRAPVACR